MSIILFILFIYILYLLLRPAFKVWRTYRKMKTGSFDIFGDLFGQPGGQRHTSQYEADGSRWTKPRSKKKKISEDVGEYVKFSEITISETESHRQAGAERNSTTITEQQVVDVEWEDLPDK